MKMPDKPRWRGQTQEQIDEAIARGEFYSPFSAGVAAAPPHTNAQSLSELADAALYSAKDKGRNQVALGE